jgi:hypothetical protein
MYHFSAPSIHSSAGIATSYRYPRLVLNESLAAPYLPAGPDRVISTQLSSAGWYDDGQHGGVVSALMAGAIEAVPTLQPMQVARLTVELFRRVPVAPLEIRTKVDREGKRIQLVSVGLWNEGVEVARSVGLRVRLTELPLPPFESLPPPAFPGRPVDLSTWGVGAKGKPVFHRKCIEVQEAEGSYWELGPAAMWMRILTPIVAGSDLTPLQRAVTVADFGNGVSRLVHTADWAFMNADLTVSLVRYPEGEWVAIRAETMLDDGGRGLASSLLFDRQGPIGRATQTLFLDRRSALPG